MATLHFMLQGKGGVGKTLLSSLLAQCLMKIDSDVLCVDTDPVNHTLSQYKSLNAKEFDIYNLETGEINFSEFDRMIEFLVENDKTAIIDNGASSFVPLTQYIIENDLFSALSDMGHKVIIHTIITGGQGMIDTINGLNSLIKSTPDEVEIIVWLNDHFGKIESNGKEFFDWQIYKKNQTRMPSIVPISFKKSQLFQDDLHDMITNKLTFDEAIDGARLMSRNRLKIMRDEVLHIIGSKIIQQ